MGYRCYAWRPECRRGELRPEQLQLRYETFDIVLSGPQGGSVEVQTPGTATITIRNDDYHPTVGLADISVSEPRYEPTITRTLTVQLSNPTWAAGSIEYHTSSGTAIGGLDFSSFASNIWLLRIRSDDLPDSLILRTGLLIQNYPGNGTPCRTQTCDLLIRSEMQ